MIQKYLSKSAIFMFGSLNGYMASDMSPAVKRVKQHAEHPDYYTIQTASRFLTPPVSSCINEMCPVSRRNASLAAHLGPTVVSE